ncbi:hypothetical protein [Arthrobacter sp. RIT-PI-e]|nr:hypothetical protein [Arthrobacter sp. RIT-PI-e]
MIESTDTDPETVAVLVSVRLTLADTGAVLPEVLVKVTDPTASLFDEL